MTTTMECQEESRGRSVTPDLDSTQPALRTCVLSMRGIDSYIARCCAYEFEETVCAIEDADLLAPLARRPVPNSSPSRIRRMIQRRVPWTVTVRPRIEPLVVDRSYDVALAVIQSPPDLAQLRSVRGWREKSQVAICYMEEVWQAWIEKYSNSTSPVHLLKEFDHIFVTCQGSVAPLQKVVGKPVHYIAPGVDTIRFRPTRRMRTTDVYYMGRRSAVTHEALIRLLEAREITYAFDSIIGPNVHDTRQHRQLLAGTIQNSRYFIVHKAKADLDSHTFGQEEVGLRYFEGAAGGAVMIGSAPRVEAFAKCFDWPDAVIPMDYDCPTIGEFLAELDRQPERMERARCQNVVQSLKRHDWCHRWSEMLQAIGLPVGDGVRRRLSHLDSAAKVATRLFGENATV